MKTTAPQGSLAYPYYRHHVAGTQPRVQRATPAQRTRIRSQLILLELPTDRVSIMHRAAWTRAGMSFPDPGAVVDDVLYGLTAAQASALIDVLGAELEDLS